MSILRKAPAGSNILDLGAARAARAEVRANSDDPKPYIKLEAGYVEINPEFDVLAAEELAANRITSGLAKLLANPEDIKFLVADGLSKNDLEEIVKFIQGVSLGE